MNFLTPLKNGFAPTLRLEEFFDGDTRAEGVFEDRFGNIKKRFNVAIQGSYDGEILILHEGFEYDDGSEENREWKIDVLQDGTYEGRASGVVGKAVGKITGDTLLWRYSMNLPVGKRLVRVRFEDKMWLTSSGDLLNRARVYKFGVLLGSITIVFRREETSISHVSSAQSVDRTKRQVAQ